MKSGLKKRKKRARHWVINGEQSATSVEGLEPEKHRLYHWKGWNHLRLQLEHEVRLKEQIAEGDLRCWLWERGIVSFPGASHTKKATDHERASHSQFCWMSKDSEAWK